MSLILKNLSKSFGDQKVLDNINMSFTDGELTVLTGQSGCGKTTLLRIISGLDEDYLGNVTNNYKNLGYLFQEDRLLPWYTSKQNISFILQDSMDRVAADKKAEDYLNLMRLRGHMDKFPSQLSGGMNRRVALARTLAYNGDLVLLDEPFKGMDVDLKDNIINVFLEEQKRSKFTAIIVTHDQDVIKKLGITPLSL